MNDYTGGLATGGLGRSRTFAVEEPRLPDIKPAGDRVPVDPAGNGGVPIAPKEAMVSLAISLRAIKGTESNHDEPYAKVNGARVPQSGEWAFGNDTVSGASLGSTTIRNNSRLTFTVEVMESDDQAFTGGDDHLGTFEVTITNKTEGVEAIFVNGTSAEITKRDGLKCDFTLTGSGAHYVGSLEVKTEWKDNGKLIRGAKGNSPKMLPRTPPPSRLKRKM